MVCISRPTFAELHLPSGSSQEGEVDAFFSERDQAPTWHED